MDPKIVDGKFGRFWQIVVSDLMLITSQASFSSLLPPQMSKLERPLDKIEHLPFKNFSAVVYYFIMCYFFISNYSF